MMKSPILVKGSERFEREALSRLRELCSRVPFLKVGAIRETAGGQEGALDGLIDLKAAGRSWTLAIEARPSAPPRIVRTAILQLQNFLNSEPRRNYYGVLVAQFISEDSAGLCVEAGLGYMDLAGNARLCFDNIFIETRASGNPFRVKRHLRSLFSGKAARLLRVLLTPPLREWKVTELATAANVSLGQVSNVRRLLLDREWGVVGDSGLRLNQPEGLARAWQASYETRPLSREATYTLLHGSALQEAIQRALTEAGDGAHAVLASYSAARWLAPYARQSTEYFYVDSVGREILRRTLQLKTVERGENVVMLEPREDDVFGGRLEAAPSVWSTGLVQSWLDLSVSGERGAEAAEHLLKERLLPAWKEGSP